MHRSTGRAFAAVSISAVAFVALGAGTASAGEITGNGTLKTVKAASICAYSGQNDGWHIPELAMGPEDAANRVQNWGRDRRFLIDVVGVPKNLPGMACRPGSE